MCASGQAVPIRASTLAVRHHNPGSDGGCELWNRESVYWGRTAVRMKLGERRDQTASIRKGRDLERLALSRAVRHHLEDSIVSRGEQDGGVLMAPDVIAHTRVRSRVRRRGVELRHVAT